MAPMNETPIADGRCVRTRGPEDTAAVGAEIAAGLNPGDVVLVSGDLGAGKSVLVRGAARALGVAGAIPSPSFTIGRRYKGSGPDVSHLDLYRLSSLAGEEPSLLDDYLTSDAVAFVEWPEVGDAELRSAASANDGRVVEVTIAPVGALEREVNIS